MDKPWCIGCSTPTGDRQTCRDCETKTTDMPGITDDTGDIVERIARQINALPTMWNENHDELCLSKYAISLILSKARHQR